MKRTTEYNSWNMAGYRARTYAPPKPYVAIAPVGNQQDNPRRLVNAIDQTCGGCGHHRCSCARQNSERAERAPHPDRYRDALIGLNSDEARRFDRTNLCEARMRQHWEAEKRTDWEKLCSDNLGPTTNGQKRDKELTAKLARTWDKCPVFVRPYPDRSHRGVIKAEVRNSERVIVYNPMAAGQADEAYMRCMSLNAQAERAAESIEANLPT